MSTHNICFYGEIRKIIPELSPNTLPQQFLWVLLSTHNVCFCGKVRNILSNLSGVICVSIDGLTLLRTLRRVWTRLLEYNSKAETVCSSSNNPTNCSSAVLISSFQFT